MSEGGINSAIASGAAFGAGEENGAGGEITGITAMGRGLSKAGFLALFDISNAKLGFSLNAVALFKAGPGSGGPLAFLGPSVVDGGLEHNFSVAGGGEGGGGQAFSSLPAMASMGQAQDVSPGILGMMAPSPTPSHGQSQDIGMGM